MNDDEVKTWLSKKEGRNLRAAAAMKEGHFVAGVLRDLAETRRALLRYSSADDLAGRDCRVCRDSTRVHSPDCLFYTIPRPKPLAETPGSARG